MPATLPTQAVIGDATFTIGGDRSVTVTAEGATHTVEQVQMLAGLGADLPEWAEHALVLHAGLRCPDLDVEEVVRVARLDWRDRAACAWTPRLHGMLVVDPHESVRARLAEAAAYSVAPTVDIQVRLARDPDFGVRMNLAKAATTCAEAALVLAGDDEPDILSLLARNTRHADALDAVLRRLHVRVLGSVMTSRVGGLPEQSWPWLAAHPDEQVRVLVALNAFTPQSWLRALTADPCDEVATQASDTLNRLGW